MDILFKRIQLLSDAIMGGMCNDIGEVGKFAQSHTAYA